MSGVERTIRTSDGRRTPQGSRAPESRTPEGTWEPRSQHTAEASTEDYSNELAIALGYAPSEDIAPRVLAAGQGELANKIRELAAQSGVELHEDEELASLLARVPSGSEIPPELYPVVAEIFAFLWALSAKLERS